MKKLTIKELAPYLPHKLQWVFEGADVVHEVVGLDITDFGVHILSHYGDSGRCSIKDGKPLLRPLSQLTQEIDYKGKMFVPILELAKVSDSFYDWEISKESLFHKSAFCNHYSGKISFCINTDFKKLYSFNTTLNGRFIQTNNPHLVYQKLHEWHFDVFGLIERGLALPIDEKEDESLTCGYCDSEFSKGTGGNYGEYGEVCANCYIGLS